MWFFFYHVAIQYFFRFLKVLVCEFGKYLETIKRLNSYWCMLTHIHTLLESGKAVTLILQKSVKNKEEEVTWDFFWRRRASSVFGLLMRVVKSVGPKGLLERQDWEALSVNLCPLYPLASVLGPCFYISFFSLWNYFILFNMMDVFESKECLMKLQPLSVKSTYKRDVLLGEVYVLWTNHGFCFHDTSLCTY